ncbi:translation initiation factor IF-2 [Staphylococcus coagulans]|uniref:translation initiation factor IF-2 n=1 Tax=Staphylococcus coagulans TaxID=74706 RepID=UPI001BE5A7BC|nr:translation initiation factor IF-2 [Staphylococcus coagulans]MBT2829775.1 translation initiation factor IF-2 [Staphylococcus coagulans]MBT2859378.1 translation initiation factor IF-2 [Staphylococcus coagulans]MBU3872875.1 translation initiation factor IF-2 [Staphylococcus coagulans]UNB47796.1 translation initiation factor IF-2 [Staphylococcus coagulans]
MGKQRIYEYAKDLNIKSKDVIDELKKEGVEVSNHMQTLEDDQVKSLDKVFKKDQAQKDTKSQKNTQSNHKNQKQGKNQKGKPNQQQKQNKKNNKGSKNNKQNKKNQKVQQPSEPKEMPSKITYTEGITVGELADKLGVDSSEIIKKLFLLGIMANINQSLDVEALELVASDYGVEIEEEVIVDDNDLSIYFDDIEEDENATVRPAVVTIMGHVDHGKTTLLDSIRHTRVTEGEAGGITQHIGAYQIENNGKKITFLDTPGHAAFTTMRARGAQVTDITILVVAADDGVMPQTIEAINHAKEADVPIIVAVNKIDKPTANPDRVMQELTEYNLIPEDWGGDTIFVPLSALSGEGIDDLLEMLILVSEVQELKANANKPAVGTVIEAELDKSRGPAASLLVQNGTLHVGDALVVGNTHGKVRAMVNDLGKRIKSAGPSTPVEITGLNDVPQAGDRFVVFKDEKKARRIGEAREQESILQQRQESKNVSLDNLFEQMKQGEMKDLNVIIKGDVQGSVEALAASLMKIDVEGVNVRIIHTATGAINESDVTLANASNGIIIGFNVRPDAGAKRAADAENVDMRLHRVIYNVIEEIEAAMKGMLDPEFEEKVIGQAEVRQTFKVSKVGTIAGSYVTEGKITRDSSVRIIRDGVVLFEGELDTLKRFKDDAKEVAQGYECGITIAKFNDIKEGDIIEAFVMVEVER